MGTDEWTASYTRLEATELPEIKEDHKTRFSAERTLMAWIHLSLTGGGIAIALVAKGDTDPLQMCGVLLMLPALFFSAWGALQYRLRHRALDAVRAAPRACESSQLLAGGEDAAKWGGGTGPPWTDRLGPLVATLMLALAISINTALAMKRAFPELTRLTRGALPR